MIHALATLIGLPNIHPAVVHYPIALAFTALLVDALWWVLRRGRWLERAGALLYGLAAVAAGFAYLAGRGAADQASKLPAAAEAVLAEHADLALWTLMVLGGAAVVRLLALMFASWDAPVRPNALHVLAGLGLLGACGLVAATSEHGGELVYHYGVAVARTAPTPSPTAAKPITTPIAGPPVSRLHELPGGGLDWQPAPGDGAALGSILLPAADSTLEAVNAVPAEEGDQGLPLAVDGEALMVFEPSYGDVEVQADLQLLDFGGRIGLASHVTGIDRAVLFSVSTEEGARLELRTAQHGSRDLATGQATVADAPFTLSLSSAGRHLKGFLDDRLLVHGHADAGGPGRVGLFLDGNGTVVIQRVRVTTAAGSTPGAEGSSE